MMSIITAVRDRVVSDRNPAPRSNRPRSRKFTQPRDIRTAVHTHESVVGFRVITDRGTFYSPGRKPGMARVVTTHEDWPPMAWYRDDNMVRNDLTARAFARCFGRRLTGGWRRMTSVSPIYDD